MAWTPFNFFKYDPDEIDFSKTTFNIKQALNNNWAHIQTLLEEIRTTVDKKVTAEEGKGLSTNDFSNTLKAKLSNINSAIIIKNNTPVAVSAWAADTTYEDYPFKASISVTGCTANHTPDVSFGLKDVTGGNLAPLAETYAGGIYIYAKEKPKAEMTIPTILLTKVVS